MEQKRGFGMALIASGQSDIASAAGAFTLIGTDRNPGVLQMTYRTVLDNFFSSQRPLFSLSNRVWNPPTDIYETEEATFIKMEVAGLDEKQLSITAQKNLLLICGKRIHAHPGIQINYHLMEVHYGSFERVFAFSYNLDQNKIKASYEQGFLLIEVEKQSPATTKVSVRIVQDKTEKAEP